MPSPDIHRDLSPQARLVTELPGPKSKALQGQRLRALPRGVGSVSEVFINSAGAGNNTGLLTDVDGNTLIDFGSGIAVNSVGAAHPDVREAITNQVDRGTHFGFPVTPYEGYLNLATKLNGLFPGDDPPEDIVSALFTTGAEAVENAVTIARAATGRPAIIFAETGFHGRTNLTVRRIGGPLASGVYRVPMSYPLRDEMTGEEAVTMTTGLITRDIGPENVAAIVFEPIAGEGGGIVPAAGFMGGLERWSSENGVVFIADEIQTGFGRTGEWYAVEHEKVVPHMMTLGKAMGGGLPISAVTGRRVIMDSVPPGGLGGTLGGNPVAAEAALATLHAMMRHNLPGRARDIEEAAMPMLQNLAADTPNIAEARGRGAMLAFEAVDPRTGRPDTAFAQAVIKEAHDQGLILLPGGVDRNVVRILPSLHMPQDILIAGLNVVKDSVLRASRAA